MHRNSPQASAELHPRIRHHVGVTSSHVGAFEEIASAATPVVAPQDDEGEYPDTAR
jgi:hypothetical protein